CSVGNHNHVEPQLFGGGSGPVGLGLGKPGRVRPPITVEAEHAGFPCCGRIWLVTCLLGHDILRNLKGGRRPPWVQGSLAAAFLRPDLPVAGKAPSDGCSSIIYS